MGGGGGFGTDLTPDRPSAIISNVHRAIKGNVHTFLLQSQDSSKAHMLLLKLLQLTQNRCNIYSHQTTDP